MQGGVVYEQQYSEPLSYQISGQQMYMQPHQMVAQYVEQPQMQQVQMVQVMEQPQMITQVVEQPQIIQYIEQPPMVQMVEVCPARCPLALLSIVEICFNIFTVPCIPWCSRCLSFRLPVLV